MRCHSIYAVGALLLVLSACSAEPVTPSGMSTPTPVQFRTIAPDILSVDVRIDDLSTVYRGEQQPDGSWIVRLNVSLDAAHTFSASWYANVEGERLLLLEQRGNFFADAATQTGDATIISEISAGDQRFNADCDALSNLQEVSASSNPLAPDSCSNTEPTPVTTAPTPAENDALPPSAMLPDMVDISGGSFLMGSAETDEFHKEDERQHSVTVADFSIGIYEVTNDQYAFFANQPGIDQIPVNQNKSGSQPATNLSLQDAMAYTDWLTANTGDTYRLPTEAEWEYAARAGTTTPFWTGETIRGDQENMNSSRTYGGGVPIGFTWGRLLDVGSLQPNPWGLYDMLGNAREYTCSFYDPKYENGHETRCHDDRSVPLVLRGGADYSDAQFSRVYYRNFIFQIPVNAISGELGFRVVREK